VRAPVAVRAAAFLLAVPAPLSSHHSQPAAPPPLLARSTSATLLAPRRALVVSLVDEQS
jgi:hypothetical protein